MWTSRCCQDVVAAPPSLDARSHRQIKAEMRIRDQQNSNVTAHPVFYQPHSMSDESTAVSDDPGSQRFYHGTTADLKPGDLIEPGYSSNFGGRKRAAYVYLTATMDAATGGAELALGDGPGRIYVVEPTGPIEDDPNLTDKRYPGNPTKSYRSRDPLRVTGEVTDWKGRPAEELKAMKDHLERLRQLGIEALED